MSFADIKYHPGMARWAPDSRSRLEQAALALYGERGFEKTTVAEIAHRAGLTERTFFRYFTDKREVLFWGAGALQDFLVGSVDAAPPSRSPIDAVLTALMTAADDLFEDRRDLARQRQAIIVANPELQERELKKMAALAAALAEALRRRGVGDSASSLAAEAGMAVFRVAFEDWLADAGRRPLSEWLEISLDELRRLTSREARGARR